MLKLNARLQKVEGYIETLSQQVSELQDHVNDHQQPSEKMDMVMEELKKQFS